MPKQATAVYIPREIFELAEQTRVKLGMNRSKFIQYCLIKTLQELSVITTAVHKQEAKE